jgi:hypothetical protein
VDLSIVPDPEAWLTERIGTLAHFVLTVPQAPSQPVRETSLPEKEVAAAPIPSTPPMRPPPGETAPVTQTPMLHMFVADYGIATDDFAAVLGVHSGGLPIHPGWP